MPSLLSTMIFRRHCDETALSVAAAYRFDSMQQWMVWCTLAAVLLLSAGCTTPLRQWWRQGAKVGPDYCRPVAPVANHWIDVDDPRLVMQSDCNVHWWDVFGDPTLDQLIASAYQQNLSLRVAGMRVIEARAQRGAAAGNLFPQSQAFKGEYSRTQFSRTSFGSIGGIFPGFPRAVDGWSTGFDMSWEFDIWGRFRRTIEASDAELNAQIESYDDILVTLIADVARSYVDLRTFETRLDLARRNVTIQQGSLELAEVRFKEGDVSGLDVEQARTNLAQTEALIPILERGRRATLNNLCILLGTPPQDLDDWLTGQASVPAAPAEVIVGIPAELLRRRPDIRRAERQLAAQSARIGIAEADLYPQFSLTGAIGVSSRRFTDLFQELSTDGVIAPGFRWNILHYGRIRNNIKVQEARFQQLAATYQDTVLRANLEAENAIVDFLQSQLEVKHRQDAVKAAQESAAIVRTQYRAGSVDFGRVFILEQTLVLAQDDLAVAQSTVATSLIRVYKSLGGGWQIRYEQSYVGGAPDPFTPTMYAPIAELPAPSSDSDDNEKSQQKESDEQESDGQDSDDQDSGKKTGDKKSNDDSSNPKADSDE
ncbi:MAG: TolC family protein [Pirellulaceae bacterium]|nr:TolC family protein [Planctomycetales bacterium]